MLPWQDPPNHPSRICLWRIGFWCLFFISLDCIGPQSLQRFPERDFALKVYNLKEPQALAQFLKDADIRLVRAECPATVSQSLHET